MVNSFCQALVVSPILALLIAASFFEPSPQFKAERAEELRLQREDELVSVKVQECLDTMGPWKCYVALKEMDEISPIKDRQTRTVRLANLITATDVLNFCDLARKVDCANKMFGAGFRTSDVQDALGDND